MDKKKWITAVAAIGLSASLAFAVAHDGNGRHWEGKGRGEWSAKLSHKLNLTEAQKQQWADIDKAFRQENRAFFEQSRQTRSDFRAAKKAGDTAKLAALKPAMDAQRAQMKKLRQAKDEKLMAILTAEQRTQFQALKAERAAHHKEHEQK